MCRDCQSEEILDSVRTENHHRVKSEDKARDMIISFDVIARDRAKRIASAVLNGGLRRGC